VLFLSQCALITPKRVVAGSVRLTPRQLHFVGDAPDERGGEGRAAGRPARTHRHWELAAMSEVRGPRLSLILPWHLFRRAGCTGCVVLQHKACGLSLRTMHMLRCSHAYRQNIVDTGGVPLSRNRRSLCDQPNSPFGDMTSKRCRPA